MTKYVVGFAFDQRETMVALMLKARPNWQRGFLNGIGGHVEPDEISDPMAAMDREWDEETQGSDAVQWTLFAKITGDKFEVYFYRGNSDKLAELESGSEGEEIVVCAIDELPENVISNLRWLLPMARTRSAHDWPYSILEKAVIE